MIKMLALGCRLSWDPVLELNLQKGSQLQRPRREGRGKKVPRQSLQRSKRISLKLHLQSNAKLAEAAPKRQKNAFSKVTLSEGNLPFGFQNTSGCVKLGCSGLVFLVWDEKKCLQVGLGGMFVHLCRDPLD